MPKTAVRAFRSGKLRVPLVEWMGALKINEPRAYVKCLACVLQLEDKGYTLGRPTAAPLRDGINELRAKVGTVNYRILYFFCNRAACLSHGFTKEGEVPSEEIDLAIARKELVDGNFSKYTADWEV